MKIYGNTFISRSGGIKKNNFSEEGSSFQSILDEKTKISFSKHASMRLDSRKINFSSEQLERVEKGVSKAASKGIKDALVIIDNAALVVNVKNRMVVTAMDNKNDNVFTNIDGAVIV